MFTLILFIQAIFADSSYFLINEVMNNHSFPGGLLFFNLEGASMEIINGWSFKNGNSGHFMRMMDKFVL